MKNLSEINDNKDIVTKEYVEDKFEEATIGDLVVNGNSSFVQGIKYNQLVPLQSKTYTGVIGSAASWVGASWAYGRVKPDNFYVPWRVVVRVSVEAAGSNYAHASSIWTLDGIQDTYMSYASQNAIQNTSYRPAYYHMYYRFNEAAINNNGTHAIGISFLYSWNYTTAANARTIKVELLENYNCTVNLLDSLETHSAVTGQSNYYTYSNFDFASNGLSETGDANSGDYYQRTYYSSRTTVAASGRYILFLSKSDGRLVPVHSLDNNISLTKTFTSEPFDPFGQIFYWGAATNYAAGASVGNGYLYIQYLCDFRYAFNIGGNDTTSTLTAKNPLYLVAAPQSNGLAILHSNPLSESLPSTDDGLIYIYLGRVYEDTNPYRCVLAPIHPVYWYKNGAIRQYGGDAATINGHTVPTSAGSAITGITVADHSSTTIYGVQSSTTSVTGVQSSTTTASKVTLGTAISVPNVTAAGSGSFTQGSFSGGSLTMSIDSTDTKKLNITFTAATHGADSHTHTPPTLGTAKSIPNITGVSDVTVPIKNTSATTVPIKNSSTTTVITSKTHTVTDNGHTHSLS